MFSISASYIRARRILVAPFRPNIVIVICATQAVIIEVELTIRQDFGLPISIAGFKDAGFRNRPRRVAAAIVGILPVRAV
jgi:hypothetical protein